MRQGPWRCAQTGDCCRAVREVVMTHKERAAVEAATTRALTFATHPDPRFTRLLAPEGCPLLDGHRCSVYAVRPTNCRRFGCGRADVTTEPYADVGPIPARFYRDKPFRRQMVLMQRQAMRDWGDRHGWSAEMR